MNGMIVSRGGTSPEGRESTKLLLIGLLLGLVLGTEVLCSIRQYPVRPLSLISNLEGLVLGVSATSLSS